MHKAARKRSLVDRLAKVAFTFVVMNLSAVVAAFAAMSRRKVWR